MPEYQYRPFHPIVRTNAISAANAREENNRRSTIYSTISG